MDDVFGKLPKSRARPLSRRASKAAGPAATALSASAPDASGRSVASARSRRGIAYSVPRRARPSRGPPCPRPWVARRGRLHYCRGVAPHSVAPARSSHGVACSFPRRAHRLRRRRRRRHRRRLAVERQARVAVLALLAHPLVVVSVATTHAGARFLDAADDLALRGRTPRSWPRTSPLVRRRRRSTSTKAASRSSCPPEAREGCRAPVARSPAPRAPPAQVIQELLRYAAMQLHVPGMRSRGPLRERTKSICGMVCGCNDRKHCVAGPDPPRTAGEHHTYLSTQSHTPASTNPDRLKFVQPGEGPCMRLLRSVVLYRSRRARLSARLA